tara:strand:- start:443 stop:955 length:513 start_codon:yes stop_codon:yes gene_type:complete
MPKAYKITSDPFFVNGSVTETAADTYTQNEISLPLDSLNQEGVLVHAVYWTTSDSARVPNQLADIRCQLTATSKTGIIGANDANLISRRELAITGGAAEFSGPHVIDFIGSEAPYQESDNLMLIATDNVFLAIEGRNQTLPRTAQFRMVCSRVKLDSAAYAALVTNELTS